MNPTILIVDDDPATHEAVGEYLRLTGYRVLHAADGARVLVLLESEPVDLLLLDVQMPVMDGFQVLEAVKREARWAAVPVILLSSLSRTGLKVRGLELGADDYVVKPFDMAELLARVKAALRRSGRLQRFPGAMQGDLSDLGLPELLQTLDLGGKAARVRLTDVGGEIVLASGCWTEARWGAFQGREALLRLLLLARGAYAVEFLGAGEPPAGAVSIRDALLEALTYLDELGVMLAWAPDREARFLEGAAPAGGEPLPLLELLARREGDLKHNARALGEAFRAGALRAVGEARPEVRSEAT